MSRATAPTAGSLGAAAGLDLDSFRPDHVARAVERAVTREELDGEWALAARLREDPSARARFRRSVAVSVTGYFRDPAQFELLERSLLPELLRGGRRVTVWSAGCADGSELASVAHLLERLDALDRALLLGSDLLEENLELARAGTYATQPRWDRRDLVRDGAPGGGWRLVLCRNVSIYLTPDARTVLHRILADALSLGGVLLLGRSERLARPAELGLEVAGPQAYRRAA